MVWNKAASFLEKFKKLSPPQKFTQSETIKIIKDILGVSLEDESVEKKGSTLFIKIKNPSIRSDIFLKKSKILEELEKKLGSNTPKDIRFQ